jgi:hypothetical protein
MIGFYFEIEWNCAGATQQWALTCAGMMTTSGMWAVERGIWFASPRWATILTALAAAIQRMIISSNSKLRTFSVLK